MTLPFNDASIRNYVLVWIAYIIVCVCVGCESVFNRFNENKLEMVSLLKIYFLLSGMDLIWLCVCVFEGSIAYWVKGVLLFAHLILRCHNKDCQSIIYRSSIVQHRHLGSVWCRCFKHTTFLFLPFSRRIENNRSFFFILCEIIAIYRLQTQSTC